MDVAILGYHKTVTDDEIGRAAVFFAEAVCGKRLSNHLSVAISLETMGTGCYGTCYSVDDRKRPREFIIALNKNLSRKSLLKSLAHEIVHVKQSARGELVHLTRRTSLWKGIEIKSAKGFKDYMFLPWEIEAYGLEENLFSLYNQTFR